MDSQAKGKRGEREAAHLWRRWYPDACRSFGQSRVGYEQPDLIGGPEVDFYIEVKLRAKRTPAIEARWWGELTGSWVKYQKLNNRGLSDPPTPLLMYRTSSRKETTGWLVKMFCEVAFALGLSEDETDCTAKPGTATIPWDTFADAVGRELFPEGETNELSSIIRSSRRRS